MSHDLPRLMTRHVRSINSGTAKSSLFSNNHDHQIWPLPVVRRAIRRLHCFPLSRFSSLHLYVYLCFVLLLLELKMPILSMERLLVSVSNGPLQEKKKLLILLLLRFGNNVRNRVLFVQLSKILYVPSRYSCVGWVFSLFTARSMILTNCYSVQRKGVVEIIANDQGHRITPSWVSFTDDERL